MSDINAEDMRCFNQVARVIGVENAKMELSIVLRKNSLYVRDDLPIFYAFPWRGTPQEYEFWCDISRGINPYNQ